MNNEWMSDDNRAIAILRVSSHRQKENSSHDTQDGDVQHYADGSGLKLVEVFRMVESAKDSEQRRKYHEAIKYAHRHKIKHVIFYMFDRETRNLTDNEANEKAVREGRLILHYARERKVIHSKSPDSEFLMRDFQAVSNKQFSRNLAAKVNDAMRRKAEDGWFPTNHLPLGYIHERQKGSDGREKKRGTIVVPDTDSRVVRLVQREFELRSQHFSLEQIQKKNLTEGFVPLDRVPVYHVSAIDRRLKNSFYRGQFHWQGEKFIGKHELIISRAILDKVDHAIGLKARYTKKQQEGIFGGGWLKCGHDGCGCHVLYDPKTKKIKTSGETKTFHYYHCTNGKAVHPSMKGLNMREEIIWEKFGSAVDQITITEDLAVQVAEALNKTHQRACDAVKREMDGFRQGLDEIKRKRNKLVDLLIGEALDQVEFKNQIKRLDEEQNQFTVQLEQAQLSINGAYLKTAKDILELATRAKTLWFQRSPQERKMFLERILSNPVLDGPSVRYELKKPFAVLAEMAQKKDWRPQGDSNPCILREREVS